FDVPQPPSSQRSKTQTLSFASTNTLFVCAHGRGVWAQSLVKWYGFGASFTHIVWASAAATTAVMAKSAIASLASCVRTASSFRQLQVRKANSFTIDLYTQEPRQRGGR